ncbi:MAG: hypothetical protein KIS66_04445 [Fimbriimonadaceae bacterium]|nr:hypothetical protein [Fimbriimonadaceae bacterium]
MLRLLTVPNWSFGRETSLVRRFGEVLEARPLRVHYLQGDVDHNRTVSAFSGEPSIVFEALLDLAALAFDAIDLNRHVGVHPRVGALDVCPFIPLPSSEGVLGNAELHAMIETFAAALADRHDLPVFLYEKSERGRHESDLPSLRRGGFGSLLGRTLNPDFGPDRAHSRLGVTVLGHRDFLVAANANLATADVSVAKGIAKEIRTRRSEGDLRFVGVRALGFYLASRESAQVSFNLTLPDLTLVDPIVDWIADTARSHGTRIAETELIGVIRTRDLVGASSMPVKPPQIVDGGPGDVLA